MSYLTQLYSELKLSRSSIYKELQCQLNSLEFIKYLEKKEFPEEIFNNFFIIYFYNDGNGYSLYGKKSFGFHVNLMFFDEKTQNWYILDYDIENILGDYSLDKLLLCSEFLKRAFCTDSAKDQIQKSLNTSYYYLRSFQQVMIFTLQEYKTILRENSNLINNLKHCSIGSKNPEENILWNLYKHFNISFNNLYEFINFLDKKIFSLDLLRAYYQNKLFEEITLEGFSNTEVRLTKEKLFSLRVFLFGPLTSSTELEVNNPKLEEKLTVFKVGKSTFFIPSSQEKTFALNGNKLTLSTLN